MTTPVVAFDSTFDAPFSSATSGTSTDVPGRLEVALNGHGYLIDHLADLNGFRHQHFNRASQPVLRAQADTTNIPGEGTLNRDGFWRRTQQSWHHGAGQTFLDRAAINGVSSDEYRFHASKGVNVWNQWTLSLLNDTSQALTSTNTNLPLTSIGTAVLVGDGNNVKVSTNITSGSPSFSTSTGTPASACASLATDGTTCYAAFGSNGIYTSTGTFATFASYSTGTVSLVGYVKGRLMAAQGNLLYNITASGALPAPLLTHPNSGFTWVGFAEGPNNLYAAGYAGTQSLIYRTAVQSDGTALAVPVVAGALPTGETIRSIKGYAGFLIVGSDLGFRIGNIDSAGNITFGPLIATSSPVMCFEPYDRFVWYGLTNYDSLSTGLGRMDLSVFTNTLVPAYASDLMVTAQGTVLAVTSQAGQRVFTVSGSGVWVQSANLVSAGTLTSGRVSYGIIDDKVAMYLDVRHEPLNGSVDGSLSVNNGTVSLLGTSSSAGSVKTSFALNAGPSQGEFFEVTLTLHRDAVVTNGPVVTRYTLRSYPVPPRTYEIIAPLIFHNRQTDLNGAQFEFDITAERYFIENLVNTGKIVSFQEGVRSYSVIVEDCTFIPVKQAFRQDSALATYDGTMVLTMREMSS